MLARHGQEVEDAAAAVVEQHDRQLQPEPPRGEQAADVVRERHVADQQHDRARRRRRPRRTPRRRCRRCRWRRGCRARAAGRRGPARTSRCRAPASRRRRTASPPPGSSTPSSAATARLGQPLAAEHAHDRLGGALVGAAPARQPVRVRRRARPPRARRRARRSSCASAAPARAPASRLSTDAGSCQAPSGSSATWRIAAEPREPRPQRLGHRQVADAQHEIGRHRRGEARIAQQRVVVGDRRLAAACAGQRVGQQRPARRAARTRRPRRRAASSRSWRPATSTPRRGAARPARSSSRVGASPRRRRQPSGARTGAPSRRRARVLGQLLLADQRLAQREVQVHRARACPRARSSRRGRRACGSSAAARRRPRRAPTSKNHLAALAEQLQLVDRLPGAVLAQLRRAVGASAAAAARAPRAPRSPPAAARRRPCPTCTRRPPAAPTPSPSPSAKKPGAALVDVRVAAQPRLARERQHQRRAARARGGARGAHPAAGQLVDERPQQHVGVGWSRVIGSARCRRASSCCTASAAPAVPGTASCAHLDRERYRPLALDLPGHGAAARSERPITFAGCVAARARRARPSASRSCGYSLGGRVALHVALAAPERVARLVLVSTHRRHRGRRASARGAASPTSASPSELERSPFEEFIERWRTQPLFAADPPEVGELARADQRRNRPACAGGGAARDRHGRDGAAVGRLGELPMPVTVLVGERDEKFRALGRRMVALLPRRTAGGRARAATGCRWRTRLAVRSRALARTARRRARGASGSRDHAAARRQRVLELREQPERRQAAVRAAARARRARRRRAAPRPRRAARRGSRRGTPRAPWARTSVAAASRPAMPPQREIFRQTASATPAPSAPGSAAVSSIATRTATRSRTARMPCRPCVGSSTSSRPAGDERLDRADRLLDAPRAVGVQAQLRARAGGGARRRDAPGVVADADLDLQALEAFADRARRLLGGPGAVERRRASR